MYRYAILTNYCRKLEGLQDEVVQTALTVSDKQKVRPHNIKLMHVDGYHDNYARTLQELQDIESGIRRLLAMEDTLKNRLKAGAQRTQHLQKSWYMYYAIKF